MSLETVIKVSLLDRLYEKLHPSPDYSEAQAESKRAVREAEARGRDVTSLAQSLRKQREENHFGARLEDSFKLKGEN